MRRRGRRARPLATAAAGLAFAVVMTGCGAPASPSLSPTPSSSAVPTAAFRPASPAVVAITEPTRGEQITGPAVHVAMTLTGARIVDTTTTAITPTEGHIHLLVNGAVTTMNYGLEQDLALPPGTYVLTAEFVAADHAPYNPRVYSDEIFITVR